ncbi:hypothetical protein STENM223S_07746 [Streptomyces tendae]
MGRARGHRGVLELVRTLIRLAADNPALGRVWAEACRVSEQNLADALAHRLNGGFGRRTRTPASPPAPACFAAAVASAAVRTAMESWASGDGPAKGPDSPANWRPRIWPRCGTSLGTGWWGKRR